MADSEEFVLIRGAVMVGAARRMSASGFVATNPATGETLPTWFAEAGPADVDGACVLAAAAFPIFSELDPEARASFLDTIADKIVKLGDELINRAMQETGLPRARLEGERGRTVGQLALFASVLRQGDWIDATIDGALPERTPLPRPDLRRRNVALGPVAVFGASNFPLAFSVAGGDTASAFAAGCPVVVKGHSAHPGTGELVASAVSAAVEHCGLPEGVFSYLPGTTHALGTALVADARIKAVGFTGSRAGGLALMRVAAAREEPIPVYAEMSSINPVILFPAAAAARGGELGAAFVQSLTMGAGQFCTNPGLVVTVAGEGVDAFIDAARVAVSQSPAQPMLTPGIHTSYKEGVAALAGHKAVDTIARGPEAGGINQAQTAILTTTVAEFLADKALGREVFGPSSVIVRAADMSEIAALLDELEGQLTATILFDPADEPLVAPLLPLLERKVGRILANRWPTGVEVCHAMVHGGPFPATSDARTTSVGALAIQRFLRPVCYQGLPDTLLPPALQGRNPLGLTRRIDGVVARD